jgi:hypothetical protein
LSNNVTLSIFRHVVFATSSWNSYAGGSFNGLQDLLFEIDKAPNQKDAWNAVKQHLAAISFLIQSGAQALSGDLNIRGE